MSNIVCNNIISSGDITVTGDFGLGTSNLNTMTVNSRSVLNGIVNCGTLNINGAITQTGAVGITTGTGKINLQGDEEIIGNKRLTTGTGEVSINGQLHLGADVNLTATRETPSINSTTGAVTIMGGLGVGGNINCTGSIKSSHYHATNSVFLENVSLEQGAYFGWNSSNYQGETYFINSRGTGGGGFYFHNLTSNEPNSSKLLFVIDGTSENVGIGVSTTPTKKLEIKGDVFINKSTSKLYFSNKNNSLLGNSSQMKLKTYGDIYVEAGDIAGSIYMNQNIICNKSIFFNNIYSQGTTESKYYWAFDGFSINTQLSNGSYFSFNNLGLEETNLINSSSALGGGGFYFHKKTPELATSKLLTRITGEGNVGINTETSTEKSEIAGDLFINNITSKLYLGVKNNYILGDSTNMAIRTNGDLYIQDTNAVVQK